MLKPKQRVIISDTTSDDDLPASETERQVLKSSSLHAISDDRSDDNSKYNLTSSDSGDGNTGSVVFVGDKTEKETERYKDKEISKDPEIVANVEDIPKNSTIDANIETPTKNIPIRQSSYKMAVGQSRTFSKEKPESKTISPKKDVENKNKLPEKKPFLRKTSYEMAITSEISKTPSPKPPMGMKVVPQMNLLSVKTMLKVKEQAALEEKRNLELHEDNKSPEKIHDESALTVPDESERSYSESATATVSTSTYEQQKFSNFEKILPLGGILTLVKEKLSSGSPCSLSDSIYSLPWDTLGSHLDKACSVESLVSSGSQTSRPSSKSTSVEELVHHLKDNRIAAWFANFEQLLRLAKIDSPNNDEEASKAEKASPRSISPQEKCSPELVKLIVHLENLKSRLKNNVKLTDLYAHITESQSNDDITNVDDPFPEIKDDNETVKIIIEQLRHLSGDKTYEVDRLNIFPHDDMMEIMLSDALPHINEHIFKAKKRSRAKKPSLRAKKFRISGEVVLLEEDLPICKTCNIMSVYILWARQIIARLDEKHIYANMPPYAENLTVIKRILTKIRETFLEEFECAKREADISNKSESFKLTGVRRKKGSRRKRRQFVKGAIEVIPELDEETNTDEDSDDEYEDVYGTRPFPYSRIATVAEPTPSTSEHSQKSETNSKSKSTNNIPGHIYDNVEFDNTSTVNKQHDNKWQYKYPNLEKYVCRYIDEKGKLVEFFPPIALSDPTQKTCRIPWWKMWKSPKRGKNKDKKPKLVFPKEPMSMNLIHHGCGRLEVMYGYEDEYPYTVGDYSAEDGRYLTLEEYLLKKYFCYKPPNEYFFSMNDCSSDITVVKVSKQSNFFLLPSSTSTYYPPIYSFVTTDFPGRCPNKKSNSAKQILRQWFSRLSPTTDRGFVEEENPVNPETVIATYNPVQQDEIYFPDRPPKVGPKPLRYQQVTKELLLALPPGVESLPPGVYFYPYDVNDEVPESFLRVIVCENRPLTIAVQMVDCHLFLKHLADLCCESKHDDGLDFKHVIFKVHKIASTTIISKYTFAKNPPIVASVCVINENDPSYDVDSLLCEEHNKPEQYQNVTDYPTRNKKELNNLDSVSGEAVMHDSHYHRFIEPDFKSADEAYLRCEHTTKQPWSYPSTSSHSPNTRPVFESTPQTDLHRQIEEEATEPHRTSTEPSKPRRHRSWSYPSTSTHSPNLLTVFEIPSESPNHIHQNENLNVFESTQKGNPNRMTVKSQIVPDEGSDLSGSSQKFLGDSDLSDESSIPDWYLPRQARFTSQQTPLESRNTIDAKKSVPDYVNLSALKETHHLIETYRYPWEDPRSAHTIFSGLLTQDKVAVRRRNSTGETNIACYENVTIPEISRASQRSLESRPTKSFGANHNRLMLTSEVNRLPTRHSPTLIPVPDDMRQQLSPSYYSLYHYPLTEMWHHPGIHPWSACVETADKIPWCYTSLYTSASRHTIGSSNPRFPLVETIHHPGRYPWHPPRRFFGTSPITFSHSQMASSSSSQSGVCASTSKHVGADFEKGKQKTLSSSSASSETNRSFTSRHSIGTVSERLKLRFKGKTISSKAQKFAKLRRKYMSRSSEDISERIMPATEKDLKAILTKTKPAKSSSENIAGRIAYHYLTEDSDTESSFSKEQTMNIKRRKKKWRREDSDTETSVSKEQTIKRKYKKKRKKLSGSNEVVAERMAHHYIIRDEGDTAMSSMSSYSYSISSSRTSQSCPVHGPSPNPVELPGERNSRTRSTPFLICGRQSPIPVQDQVGSVDRRNSPIWFKKTRTRTV